MALGISCSGLAGTCRKVQSLSQLNSVLETQALREAKELKLFNYPSVTKCFLNFPELGGQRLRLPECEGSRELRGRRPHPHTPWPGAQRPRPGVLGLSLAEQIFVSTLHKNTLELIVFTLQMLCK